MRRGLPSATTRVLLPQIEDTNKIGTLHPLGHSTPLALVALSGTSTTTAPVNEWVELSKDVVGSGGTASDLHQCMLGGSSQGPTTNTFQPL